MLAIDRVFFLFEKGNYEASTQVIALKPKKKELLTKSISID
jgi:hypothetical protein